MVSCLAVVLNCRAVGRTGTTRLNPGGSRSHTFQVQGRHYLGSSEHQGGSGWIMDSLSATMETATESVYDIEHFCGFFPAVNDE